MNEIEKMYENAGVEPQYKKRIECKDGYAVGHPCQKGIACINCNKSVFEDIMPPFTAEKQLELIKWLIINRGFKPDYDEKEWGFSTYYIGGYYRETFKEALANLLNNLWQSLAEQEQKQIRDILRG